jgi:multidrug transporter EmrE-like cation transporter
MNLLKGILFGLAAQITTFLQLQGQMKIEWFKNHTFLTVLMGIPISYMFMMSVKYIVTSFDGQLWPSRLIGFGIGVIVFTVMSLWLFKEPLTPKTLTCLGLAFLIVALQVFWK